MGSRVFDVSIDGTKVLDKLDIVQEVGPMAPLVETFTVNETGNSLTISFAHEIRESEDLGHRDRASMTASRRSRVMRALSPLY